MVSCVLTLRVFFKLSNSFLQIKQQINDISLEDYIAVKPKYATFVPHSAGRYAAKRFRKAQCPIVERIVNSLMMHGRNNGKKLMAARIVRHAMDIIFLLTDQNPLQVVVDAIINAGPRADARGVFSRSSVDDGIDNHL